MKKMFSLLVAGTLISIRLFAQDLTTNGMHTIIRDGYTVNWSNSHLELRTNDNSTPWMTFHRAGYSWRALGFDGSDFIDNYSNKFLLSSNFNSFAPTLTGIGASGNWNINATSATQWNGYPGALSTFSSGADLTGLIGIHPNGTAYRFDAPNVKYFLGIPSGGETLQSVTDRDNVTNNVLQITGIGHGKTNTLGLELDYNGYGDNRGRVFSYDRVNNIYKGLRLEGSDLIINAASGGNVGIGIIAPATTFHVGDNSSVVYSTAIAGHGGTDIVAIGNRSGIASINGYANDFSAVKNLALNPDGGYVGIGTTNPTQKLSVDGTVLAKKVKVSQSATDWPDYVFDSSYQLTPLYQVEKYIQQNKHLPEVPSAAEVKKDGIDLGDNQAVLLKKIEELTLYIIEQNKKLEAVCQEVKMLKADKK
jgi:hypothetical protein